MPTPIYKISVLYLLSLSLCITSCRGQTSTPQSREPSSSANTHEPNSKIIRTQGIQSGVVKCELVDLDGNLWFSISGEGAYRYDGESFTNLTVKDGLCNNYVNAIIQDRAGNILLGTNSGICRYDGMTFTQYPVPDTLSITCMLEDRDGYLWFGTNKHGVYRYNGKALENFLNSRQHEYNLGSNYQLILDILQDRNGNLWFSSWNGGGVWKYDGSKFTNFVPSADYYKTNEDNRAVSNTTEKPLSYSRNSVYVSSQEHISDDMIFSMAEDPSGNIWFATRDHGICRYNGTIFTNIGKNEGFSSRDATAILTDEKDGFWITTFDSGVWYYDGYTFTNLTEKDGLVNNAVMNLLKDKAGNIWFGTKFFGLSRYDGTTFTTFSQYDN